MKLSAVTASGVRTWPDARKAGRHFTLKKFLSRITIIEESYCRILKL